MRRACVWRLFHSQPYLRSRNVRALHSQEIRLWHFSRVSVSTRKLLPLTLMVKGETSMTRELWAAFTAVAPAATLAEIANFSRAQPNRLRGRRVRTCAGEDGCQRVGATSSLHC